MPPTGRSDGVRDGAILKPFAGEDIAASAVAVVAAAAPAFAVSVVGPAFADTASVADRSVNRLFRSSISLSKVSTRVSLLLEESG